MRNWQTPFRRLQAVVRDRQSDRPERVWHASLRRAAHKPPQQLMVAAVPALVAAMLLSASPGIGFAQSRAALRSVNSGVQLWSNAAAVAPTRHVLSGSDAPPQRSSSGLQGASTLAVGAPESCAGGENLLENGGFEAGTEGWYVNESVEAVTTETHEGAMAVRLAAGDDDAYTDNGVSPIDPGATYTLSAWGRVSTGGETGEIGVQYYDSGGERLMNEEPPPLTFSTTAYEERELTFSPPDDIANIYVFISKVEGAADFYADSLTLTICSAEASAEMPVVATPVAALEESIVATPEAAQSSETAATPAEPAPDRSGCDPAYPEERTCIPPGPPFDQGCAITMERDFIVLPQDPQGLDHDQDGVGCEPIS